ncbi:MAG TPA: hypothetical protein VG034_12965 [Acidimicrobiia bacterium]|nr:hypothetical protein [Acidimicrobiia bacterium]
MFPWKMFFRSFSALVLFLTGGFAAGPELPLPMPFETNPTEAAAPAAPTVDETTTTTAAPVDETTTTTTTIASDTLPVVEPVPAPEPTATPEPTSPAQPVKPAPPVAAPAPAPAPDAPPAAPVDPDAPSVCAAAATRACGTAPTADNSHDARVQRCEAWWTSLAQALNDNGRPDWAARATKIASHCDAIITRWEQMEQRWRERQDKKGDPNNDRRPDNGWHKRGEPDRHREGR